MTFLLKIVKFVSLGYFFLLLSGILYCRPTDKAFTKMITLTSKSRSCLTNSLWHPGTVELCTTAFIQCVKHVSKNDLGVIKTRVYGCNMKCNILFFAQDFHSAFSLMTCLHQNASGAICNHPHLYGIHHDWLYNQSWVQVDYQCKSNNRYYLWCIVL